MHPYITDSNERRDVPLGLAAIAIFLSWILSSFFKANRFEIPGWLDLTSVAGFYAGLYALFDRLLWRWSVLHRLHIVRVPVLSGSWAGYVLSSYDNFGAKHSAKFRIEQDWTRMRILFEGNFSRSRSFIGAIFVDAGEGTVLDYEYQSDPLPDAVEAMQIHYGTARLKLVSGNVLEGHYYTGRGRSNFGRLHLT